MTAIRRAAGLALGLGVCLGLLAPRPARGDTVDAKSNTLLTIRDQMRAGGNATIAPVYEILSVSARDVTNPVAENLQLVFSGWGALSLGSNLALYDNNPPVHRAFADLDLAFLQGELLKQAVQVRLGRQLVTGGVTGSLQVDGAHALLRLPFGFGLAAYVGSPVSQRFEERGTEGTWNPQRGSLAFGGRASWAALPGWFEIGASAVDIKDRGDPSRQQVGADVRVTPWRPIAILANTNYDLYESRWAETNLVGQFQLLRKLLVTADYRHIDPDLLLARNSILAVFAADRRWEVGGGAQYDLWKSLTVGADYHHLSQDQGDGHRVQGRALWRPSAGTTVGAEVGHLSLYTNPSGSYLSNGYFVARAFGSKKVNRFTGTLDLQEYRFQQPINGHQNALEAIGTLGYDIGRGWAVLVAGTAGESQYYSSRFDFLAKLAYSQSYHSREVR